MKMRLAQETAEKGELIAEIRRQHESMDELGDKHRQLVENVMSKEDEVNKLEVVVEVIVFSSVLVLAFVSVIFPAKTIRLNAL